MIRILTLCILACSFVIAQDSPKKISKNEQSLKEARELKVDVPVMCREWHIWWKSPWGRNLGSRIEKWKGVRKFKKFTYTKNIEDTVPGLAWRRYLGSMGYPLLGPYDSSQDEIIRWQLQTAKNTGMECMHLQIWPDIWGEGMDLGPIDIMDKAFAIAAELNFPIAVHDEVQFRRPRVSKAQTLKSSIARTVNFIKRYGKHKGMYKIDGMPFYFFQNWSNWANAENLRKYVEAVEKEVGPVYWVVEMSPNDEVLKIPQIKAFCGTHTDSFMGMEPNYGKPPHDWEKMKKLAGDHIRKIQAAGKKAGLNLKTRFNNNNVRGKPGRGIIPAENGKYLLDSIRMAKELKPDFIIIAQWNDYEEGGFIEPSWDFDGYEGDPYFWCKLVSALIGKREFTKAALPPREIVDPLIRKKLYGTSKIGDSGPVMQNQKLKDARLIWKWAGEGSTPKEVRIMQDSLAVWNKNQDLTFIQKPLRLANSSKNDDVLTGKDQLVFYAPGLISDKPKTYWLGITCTLGSETGLKIKFHAYQQWYRDNCRWVIANARLQDGYKIKGAAEKEETYWLPLYNTKFTGKEGDLVIELFHKKHTTTITRVVLWSPDMAATKIPVKRNQTRLDLPKNVDPAQPFIVNAYDKLGNAGIPRLFIDRKSNAPGGDFPASEYYSKTNLKK